MPDLSFHIGLEVFTQSGLLGKDTDSDVWLEAQRTLSPFLSNSSKANRSTTSRRNAPQTLSENRIANTISEQATHDEQRPVLQMPASSAEDKRVDQISIEGTDMNTSQGRSKPTDGDESHINKGIGSSPNDLQTKGRYVPLDSGTTNSVWGIVHLYRDAEEIQKQHDGLLLAKNRISHSDADCTTLAILAVPSYMAPSDFLGFVGEKSRDTISHFRMIRTARANRYMVLMKFRQAKEARVWREEWNGRLFNSMEPETCHVVFIRSIEITSTPSDPSNFPASVNGADPFLTASTTAPTSTRTLGNKPAPPPTRSLIELPTCPVCLERMDETNGLLTILCQHVFHCTCLQKWSGGGCPVCRYTHDDFSSRHNSSKAKSKSSKLLKSKYLDYEDYDAYASEESLECQVCHASTNLWQCLICGHIGCGRYDAAHAFAHQKSTQHAFAMDMESKRVWSYAADAYVHRIMANVQDGSDGKLVELPDGAESALDPDEDIPPEQLHDDGALAAEKLETLSLEYTHLLTSQLESQRVYFEEKVERAADKAAKASAEAASATSIAQSATSDLAELKAKYEDTVPGLERENARLLKRASRFEEMSRGLAKDLAEERVVGGKLMERIKYLESELEKGKAEKETAVAEKRDLEEMNRDLQFFISGAEKVKQLEGEGEGVGAELRDGTVSVPDPPQSSSRRNRKGKGKG